MRLKPLNLQKIVPLSLLLLIFPLTSCQVEREQAGKLPKVEVEPGRLPEYNIQGPDVKVGVAKRTVTVPKVIVIQEQETVEVPYVDIDVPGADRQERTITTEVEVPSGGYNLDIQGIYTLNNELWVVSQLKEENPNAPKAKVRVSDRVIVNAPDVPVRHYIIGKRPQGEFNQQYTFIDSRQQIASKLESGQLVYKKQEENA